MVLYMQPVAEMSTCMQDQHNIETGMQRARQGELGGLLLVSPPDKKPVVDIAQRVGHEGLTLIMPPLSINNKFVLVVPAKMNRSSALVKWQSRAQRQQQKA